MLLNKCPQCKKTMLAKVGEDSNERVMKIRLLRFRVDGGPVWVKCRHCGHLIKVPQLKLVKL